MARGKQTCRILKEIRRQIAEANDIEFATSECRYKGDCLGTCPKCEAEVSYLEQQLRARSLAGKAVTLAGISAGLVLMAGCGGSSAPPPDKELQGDTVALQEKVEVPSVSGDVSNIVGTEDESAVEGMVLVAPRKPCAAGGEGRADDSEVMQTVGEVPGYDVSPYEVTDGSDTIYSVVEEMPEFPGGSAALHKFIADNLRYPEELAENCIQGRVIVDFCVDTLGRVRDPKIKRSLHPALDKEAIRVVGLLPDFKPGRHNGRKVNVRLSLPIIFRLES